MTLRSRLTLAALAVLITAPAGCSSGSPNPPDDTRPAVRVTSFDFSESRVLGEVYAAALQRRGVPVRRILELGPREVVQPALQQGLVDLVPEYLGSALTFFTATDGATPPAEAGSPPPAANAESLRRALARRGLIALTPANAQDRNGFAVTTATARARHLRRISDLNPVAATLVFGGPPECPQRPYCLLGLRSRYGLSFRSFLPMPTRAATAEALELGEIGVGMLETTDGHLGDGRLVLLADDARLQPAENIVPVLRRAVMNQYGAALGPALNAVSAKLTGPALIELNRQVEVDHQSAAQVAAAWVAANVP